MPSEPITLPILDPGDVLTAAYDQLIRYRAYIEAAREITRGSSTPRPAPNAHVSLALASNARSSASAASLVAIEEAIGAAPRPVTSKVNSTKLLNLPSPTPASTPSPFSEHLLLLPIPFTLRLTPLTLTLHASLPVFYAERPLLGIDSHSLVILARDIPSRHHPPSPCSFACIYLPTPIDPARCTAAFHHGSLGIRLLRAPSASPRSS